MNTLNFDKVIAHIEADPKQWNQCTPYSSADYADVCTLRGVPGRPFYGKCFAAQCVAGWATEIAFTEGSGGHGEWVEFVANDGTNGIIDKARTWLGLTDEQASYAFSPYRSWEQIKAFRATEGASA